jgi:hypothetical protein
MTSQKEANRDRRTDFQLMQRIFRRVLTGTEGQIPLAYIEDITESALTGTEGHV